MQNDIKQTIATLVKNKYVVSFTIFLLWIGLLDEDNLITQYEYSNKIEQLTQQREQLKESIEQDKRKMNELKNDKVSLEKFAREEYFMKKNNEVIFIIK